MCCPFDYRRSCVEATSRSALLVFALKLVRQSLGRETETTGTASGPRTTTRVSILASSGRAGPLRNQRSVLRKPPLYPAELRARGVESTWSPEEEGTGRPGAARGQ